MEDKKKKLVSSFLGWIFVFALVAMLALGFSKKGIYSSVLGINIVVVGDSGISLMLFRPREEIVTVVKMPDNLSVKIVDTGAVYPLSSLWDYGVLEKDQYEIVGDSLSNTVGVLLPRAVKIKGETSPENLLGNLHRINLQTDLSIRDRILLRKDLVTSVSSKKYLEIDIPKSAMTKMMDPDGKEFLEINYVVSLWTKNKFVFDALLGENANVRIRNLSQVNGAGLLLSRQLESSGVRVVEVGSGTDKPIEGKGCVFKSDNTHVYTEYLLKNYANCKRILTKKENMTGEGIEVWIL